MKKYLSMTILGLGLLLTGYQSAYAESIKPMPAIEPSCVEITSSLRYGNTDSSSNGLVSKLQEFLSGQGYFESSALGTGRFGPITRAAVIKFQVRNGVQDTGFVGPLTRAAILRAQTDVCSPVSINTTKIYSLNPSSAAVGDEVSITGFGFSNSNTVLIDGGIAAQNVPVSATRAIACTTDPDCKSGIQQTLVFQVPGSISPYCAPGMMCPMYMRELTAGNYKITVRPNTFGSASNELPFTITE